MPCDTLVRRVADAELPGSKRIVDVVLDPPDAFEVDVGEDRVIDLEPLVGSTGVEIEKIRAGTDQRHQRHHRLFANRIDRRVGDLGEALLEVVEEHLRAVREDCGRRVATHRTDRVLTLGRHRLEEELDVLLGVAEGLLSAAQRLGVRPHRGNLGR